MAKQKTTLVRQKKNTVGEYCLCIFFAVVLLILGIAGIHNGSVRIGGTRRIPGTLIYGEEARTVAVAYIGFASLLILWLCRHRVWLPRAIAAALIANVIVAILAFNQG
jgi:hypothetical protein